jgi:hypothetical protein
MDCDFTGILTSHRPRLNYPLVSLPELHTSKKKKKNILLPSLPLVFVTFTNNAKSLPGGFRRQTVYELICAFPASRACAVSVKGD